MIAFEGCQDDPSAASLVNPPHPNLKSSFESLWHCNAPVHPTDNTQEDWSEADSSTLAACISSTQQCKSPSSNRGAWWGRSQRVRGQRQLPLGPRLTAAAASSPPALCLMKRRRNCFCPAPGRGSGQPSPQRRLSKQTDIPTACREPCYFCSRPSRRADL